MRRAQLELQLIADRYGSLYDHSPVGYLTVDAAGLVRECNLKFADLVAMPRQMILGRRLVGFVLRAVQSSYYSFHRKLLESDTEVRVELQLQPIEGEPFWLNSLPYLRRCPSSRMTQPQSEAGASPSPTSQNANGPRCSCEGSTTSWNGA